MSRILFFSDLHLGDARNSRDFERQRLQILTQGIRRLAPEVAYNLGDTVSRTGCLREPEETQKYFQKYLAWKKNLPCPVIECALTREKEFFVELFAQPLDYCQRMSSLWTAFALAPQERGDHRLSGQQWQWLEERLALADTPYAVVGTHVPIAGTCSRHDPGGYFLHQSNKLKNHFQAAFKHTFWAGGHFHWQLEKPAGGNNFTCFMGGCFAFENGGGKEYFRMLELKKQEWHLHTWTGEDFYELSR